MHAYTRRAGFGLLAVSLVSTLLFDWTYDDSALIKNPFSNDLFSFATIAFTASAIALIACSKSTFSTRTSTAIKISFYWWSSAALILEAVNITKETYFDALISIIRLLFLFLIDGLCIGIPTAILAIIFSALLSHFSRRETRA